MNDLPLRSKHCRYGKRSKEGTKMLNEINREIGTQKPGFETISAQRMSDRGMKRTYFPGITDIVVVTDPDRKSVV